MKRCASFALLTSLTAGAASAADPVELSVFIALARPEPTLQVRYGAESPQGIDIFLPVGSGPHPVAILIHGGCWSTAASGHRCINLGRIARSGSSRIRSRVSVQAPSLPG
jgi:hypothetical protein